MKLVVLGNIEQNGRFRKIVPCEFFSYGRHYGFLIPVSLILVSSSAIFFANNSADRCYQQSICCQATLHFILINVSFLRKVEELDIGGTLMQFRHGRSNQIITPLAVFCCCLYITRCRSLALGQPWSLSNQSTIYNTIPNWPSLNVWTQTQLIINLFLGGPCTWYASCGQNSSRVSHKFFHEFSPRSAFVRNKIKNKITV